MSEPVTSNISVTRVGTSVRNKKSIYTATKVTKTQSDPPKYNTEIIRYSDAKGTNPVTIGTRNADSGKIEFNDNASATEKKYTSQLGKTSTNQMKTPEIQSSAGNASEKAALNKAAGQGNQALGSGVSTQQQGGKKPVGGQGGNKTKYSSGVNKDPQKAPTAQEAFNAKTKAKGGSRLDGFPNPLVFPTALTSIDRDVIKINMMQYLPSGFGGGGKGKVATDLSRKKNTKIIGSVILPIPGGISDTNAVDWGSGTMNPIQAAAANIALTSLKEGFTEGGKVAKDLAKEAAKQGPDVKKGIASMIAGAATDIGKQALQRGEGMVLNPNMELLFNGPQLRNFGFTFRLSPRSQKEASTVVKIIKFFKQGMSPIRSESNFFLKAPHTFQLEYKKGGAKGDEHPFLNKFKECALQNCTVQYTPDGNYNTFADGVMTSYSLALTFNELEPVFNDDYGDADFDATIGY